MNVKSESEVAQSCLTLRDPVDCSPPGSSVHGIFQARALEWGAMAFSEMVVYKYLQSEAVWVKRVKGIVLFFLRVTGFIEMFESRESCNQISFSKHEDCSFFRTR